MSQIKDVDSVPKMGAEPVTQSDYFPKTQSPRNLCPRGLRMDLGSALGKLPWCLEVDSLLGSCSAELL